MKSHAVIDTCADTRIQANTLLSPRRCHSPTVTERTRCPSTRCFDSPIRPVALSLTSDKCLDKCCPLMSKHCLSGSSWIHLLERTDGNSAALGRFGASMLGAGEHGELGSCATANTSKPEPCKPPPPSIRFFIWSGCSLLGPFWLPYPHSYQPLFSRGLGASMLQRRSPMLPEVSIGKDAFKARSSIAGVSTARHFRGLQAGTSRS